MSLTITRRLEADIGHRLLKHEGKCRNLHGHRYVFELEVEADGLDDVGRVVDFSVLKEVVGGWIDTYWDHGFVGQLGDPLLATCMELGLKNYALHNAPTAENMASHLAEIVPALLQGRGLRLRSLVCWETPNGKATIVLDT